jgi:23S rRNA (guanosine2251-2'-O)-methyltransferase
LVEYLYRRNTVLETLRGSRRILHRLWLQEGLRQVEQIVDSAERRGIPIESATKSQLTDLTDDGSHQGVVLEVGPFRYSEVEEILALSEERSEMPLLLLLDLLHGPRNIGTLLRTAEVCGVHGVIVQDRRAPDITPHVVIYSAGAAEHLLVAQVTNLVQTIQKLKAADVWVAGLDLSSKARPLGQVDLNLPVGIVVGNEGSGLRRLVRESCDFLLELPMRGHVGSLNAATAGAITLYAAWQARGFEGASKQS